MMAGSYITLLVLIYSIAFVGLLLLPYIQEKHHHAQRHAHHAAPCTG